MKITTVDFTGGGDGVYAMYIDDKLHKYGDYYHDKIETYIRAFTDSLIHLNGDKIEEETIRLGYSSPWIVKVSELAGTPPQTIGGLYEGIGS